MAAAAHIRSEIATWRRALTSAAATTIRDLTGARVEFTATVTKSDWDETFGFAKRPANAKVLEGATA